ncbi:hypothetical protein Tco_1459774, partial [Tanacetum coccineum]
MIQTKEGKVDSSKALDPSLVITESSGTKFEKQDIHIRLGNDADTDDADIKPIYDEEPMAKVQLTAKCNAFANDQQHAEQPVFKNEGGVDQDAKQCHDKHISNPYECKQTLDVSASTLNLSA